MKFLKFIFFLILIVLIGGVIYFATKDGHYDISESKVIQAPQSLIFNTVNDYKTWEEWGPWKKEEPDMNFTYPEQTSGVGAGYSWDGNVPGNFKTTALEQNKSIQQDLMLITPGGERFPKVSWMFEPSENGATKVTWNMKGEHPLMDKVYYALQGIDFDQSIREMYQKGLGGLEDMVKNEMDKFTVNVKGITEHGGGFYVYKTSSASSSNISTIMGKNYGAIMQFMGQNQIASTGMPFTIYNQMNPDGSTIMSNAIPVQNKVVITGESTILCGYMPRSKTLQVSLKGNYTHLGEAWEKAMTYLPENNLEQSNQNPFEIYTNDPGQFPNPADWTTEIYIPIK